MYLVIEVRLCVFSSTTFLEKEKKEEKGRTYMYNVYVDFRAYLYHQQISMFILTLLNNLFRKWVKKTEKIHGLPLPISNSFPSPSPPFPCSLFFPNLLWVGMSGLPCGKGSVAFIFSPLQSYTRGALSPNPNHIA